MSETLTDTTPAPEPTPTPDPAPVADAATSDSPQDPPQTTEPAPEPDPAPKPDKIERRIANLTRKLAEESRAREAAERAREAAESLLRVNRPDTDETPPQQRTAPPVDIQAEARRLVAQERFTTRLTEIDAKGKAEIGADTWEQAKATLTGLGAVNNEAFLQALAETDAPHKIFATLADDTDALMDLLGKTPAAMAAKLGRMDAELSRPAAKPLSSAPAPAAKVKPSGVVPEANVYDYPSNMSMKEWNAMMDKVLPPSLGGKRKAG